MATNKNNDRTKKPNFLFIITDQQRADWLGCMGHPVVRTPNIDSIALQGTAFEDFHVALPVCMPNRASLMTGRMPSVNGLRYNGCALSRKANTFVDVLSVGGYRTASIGKSHLQPFTGKEPVGQEKDTIERLIPEAWKSEGKPYLSEEPSSFKDAEETEFETPYYGFQHVDMVTGHGYDCGGHYGQWFRKTYPNWKDLHDRKNELPHNYSCAQAFRTAVPEEAYPTTWIGDRAVNYINESASHDEPFFAFVSFPDPHHPFNPPGKYWDMYSPDEFSVDLPYAAHKNPTPPMEEVTRLWEAGEAGSIPTFAFRASDEHVKEAKALTAGMITMIDDQVGRLLQSLKDSGQYENTVIVFTSDHGDYLGDFNMMLKGPLKLGSITRVPMIWSDPSSRTAVRTDTMGSTIDLSASILDRAGLAPYNGMQGRSFLESLSGNKPHRDEVLIEFNNQGPRMGMTTVPRVRTLRSKTWRLSVYAGEDWGELYNLQKDPNETHNLWDEPNAREAKLAMSLRLVEHLAQQTDSSPKSNRLA